MIAFAFFLAALTPPDLLDDTAQLYAARCAIVFDVLENGSTSNVCTRCAVSRQQAREIRQRYKTRGEGGAAVQSVVQSLERIAANQVAAWQYEAHDTASVEIHTQLDFPAHGEDAATAEASLPHVEAPTRNPCSGYTPLIQH